MNGVCKLANYANTARIQASGKRKSSWRPFGIAALIVLIMAVLSGAVFYTIATTVQVPFNTTQTYSDFEFYSQTFCDDVLVPFVNTSCGLKSNLSSDPKRKDVTLVNTSSIPIAAAKYQYFSTYLNISRLPRLRVAGNANASGMSFKVMNQENFDRFVDLENYTSIITGNGDFSFFPQASDYYIFVIDNGVNPLQSSAGLTIVMHYDINQSHADLNSTCIDTVLYTTEQRCRDVQRKRTVERTRVISRNESLLERWRGTNSAVKV